ncbi:MAG: DUF503 domain-containing protein [candidate division Zixibacteria bacterium]|nr:DUF503 domain-containing protein [candidate division Zixibacteria bacterium]
MFVARASIDLHIPQSASLKDKRHVLRALKDRLHNKFNISVAEVDHNDLWQRSTLGAAVVSNEQKFAQQVMSQVVEYIRRENGVVVLDYFVEIV